MPEPKDIVVYLDSTDPAAYAPRIRYAAALGQRWDAHVAVAFAPEDVALDRHSGFARGGAVASMLDAYERRKQESVAAIRKLLDEAATRYGIACELRICEGEMGEALMLHARHAAMAILGSSRRPDRQVSALTLSEDVIFASGRPSILIPQDWPADRATRKVVIGWNASREAVRAISDAMPFLTGAEEVHLVVVPEPKISRLLGQDPGTDISLHLARYGVRVILDRLDGKDAGELILSKAREVGADMIVMGAYGQPKITEFVFGSATQRLLAHPDIPVLLSR